MIVCFICKEEISCFTKVFFNHLKTVHGLNDRNARYCCCQEQCCRTFGSKYALIRHIESVHPDALSFKPQVEVETDLSHEVLTTASSRNSSVANESMENEIMEQSSNNFESVSDLACKFICQGKRGMTTLEGVNSMVNACTEIIQSIVGNLYEDFKALKTSPSESTFNKLESAFKASCDPFAGLKTNYQQTEYIRKMNAYIPPIEYPLSRHQTYVTHRLGQFVKPQMQNITAQFISIKSMILALNEHTDLIKTCASVFPCGTSGVLKSFVDGSYWRNHPLFDTNVIIIRLYGDDFEPANPLGSHRCIYKVGCIYYQFENLPAHLQSKTDNVFLALCYHSEDVKAFGWGSVFDPLVKELKILETEGVDLMINNTVNNYKVVISCFTGDNLFLNGLLGFVESFTAHHPCRHCVDHRSNFSNRFVEDIELIRNIASYDEAVKECNVQESGIKEQCVLNQLTYFHSTTNYVQDVMHDMLEGVCSYDMRLICLELTDLVPLDCMNSRMQSVNFGYHDLSSKPPVITSLDNAMLTFEAAEMWCFVRYFPIAIGSLVPRDNRVWLLYLHLRQIMDLVFAPEVLVQEIDLLRVLISEYLEMRHQLFPSASMKNKHHHMIHYPRIMQLMGPMVRYWCMRFEQKHQRYKRLMHISNNFKNVPKTIAVRHQNDVASRLLTYNCNDIEVGRGETVLLCELANGKLIDEVLGGGCLYMNFFRCSTVTIHGTLYKCGCYLVKCVQEETGMPRIVQLIDILVRDQCTVFFFCENLTTLHFDEHYFAWSVERCYPKEFCHVNPLELKYYLPHSLNCIKTECGNGNTTEVMEQSLICLRHKL